MSTTQDGMISELQRTVAELRRELAEAKSEWGEALAREVAVAEVLQVINASPGNLMPVFDAILDKAHRACGASVGSLVTYDGELFRVVVARGYPEQVREVLRQPFRDGPLTHGLSNGERLIHIPDIRAVEFGPDENISRALIEHTNVRTRLFVPFRKDGNLLGYISAYRREVHPFSEKEITLLESFAAQAVIAMENARLIDEQREALQQQTAAAEVLQVINASPGNLNPVFDAMLERAMRLCDAAFGVLFIADHDVVRVVRSRNVPPAFNDYLERDPPRPDAASLLGHSMRERIVLNVADLRETAPYRNRVPLSVAAVELGDIRSICWVPLLHEATTLGLFAIFRQEVRPFTDKQITLLENFAAQAVIAMENARLITETREALAQQTATSEVLQVINSSPGDLKPVFDAMLEKSMRLCEAAFGILATFDGERFTSAALRGVPTAYADYQGHVVLSNASDTVVGRVIRGTDVVHIPDLMAEDTYQSGNLDRRALVDLGGARSSLTIALRKDNRLFGMITIYRQEVKPFNDRQIGLLRGFAAQAVIAIENARLLNEVRQRQEELSVTFENMGDGVAMFDETHRLVAWNRKFQNILDVPDDIIARRQTFAQYVRYLAERGEYGPEADTEEQVRQLLQQAGRPRTYERSRPDGRVIEVRHNPVPSGGFVLIFSDITERKRNEAEIRASRDAAEEASRTIEAAYRDLKAAQANLIQAEKMASLGQLTAGIAHEIKNPLNFVNNFAELSGDLLDELQDAVATNQKAEIDELTATLKGNLAKIAEHGKRADGIVRGMLEHSRGSTGERRSVNLNTLADEALNLAYHGARAQDQDFNITLRRDLGEDIAPITLVPQDITRVLLNLFNNGFYAAHRRQAMEATPDFEPTLSVVTRELDDAVEIRVRDNGIGIPDEVKDKLFQPFFTTKPTGEGTGLGLSISYDVVTQQHGGSITVDSKVGEYSEFMIRLPRSP